jgi:hypothetical protein
MNNKTGFKGFGANGEMMLDISTENTSKEI